LKLRQFPLLTDEIVDPDVVAGLRGLGFDVLDVVESSRQAQATLTCSALPPRKGEWSSAMTPTLGR
jgi:hypothetical protein